MLKYRILIEESTRDVNNTQILRRKALGFCGHIHPAQNFNFFLPAHNRANEHGGSNSKWKASSGDLNSVIATAAI